MADAPGIVCEVDSPFASGLAQALESIREVEEMDAFVAWLAAYRSEELHAGELIAERIQRFKKVNDAFDSFYLSYRVSTKYCANEAASEYLRDMETALRKILAIDEGVTENAEELLALLRSSELEALAARLAALAPPDEETATKAYLEGYERQLRDNAVLVKELVRVLAIEYTARVDGARARVMGRARSLRATIEHLRGQIAGMDVDIDELSRDESLATDDRNPLLRSFVRRRSELSKSLAALEGKALVIEALLGEYRSITARFSGFLARLQGQLARLTARNGYLRRLRSAGLEGPNLAAILGDARGSLLANAEVLEETFMLLDEGFQNELLAAVDSDRAIGNVTVRLKETPRVAFVLSSEAVLPASPLSIESAAFAALDDSKNTDGKRARSQRQSRRSIRPAVRPPSGSDADPP